MTDYFMRQQFLIGIKCRKLFSTIPLYCISHYMKCSIMPNTTYLIILTVAIFISIGGILLYRRWQAIKIRNNLNRKAGAVHIPDFVNSSIKADTNVHTLHRIQCSGQFEFIQQRNNALSRSISENNTKDRIIR